VTYAQYVTTLPTDRYSHVVGTLDGTDRVLYVDGTEVERWLPAADVGA
jgi:hypothetical protein